MIAEYIFSAVCGIIAGAVISWFAYRFRQKRIKNPNKIISNLEKQEKEGKRFFVEGKQVDWRKRLIAQENLDKHVEEIKQDQVKQPYTPADLPPVPPKTPEPPKEPEPEPKQSTNSLNKILGRR